MYYTSNVSLPLLLVTDKKIFHIRTHGTEIYIYIKFDRNRSWVSKLELFRLLTLLKTFAHIFNSHFS